MSSVRPICPTCTEMMRRIIRPHLIFECQNQRNDHWHWWLIRRIREAHVGSSDPEEDFLAEKSCSLVHHPSINPTCNFIASDNPIQQAFFSPQKHALWYMLPLKIWSLHLLRRIIQLLWSVYPTLLYRIIRTHWIFPVSVFWLGVDLNVDSFCFQVFFWVALPVLSWSWANVQEI